jgi:hypothetical protein
MTAHIGETQRLRVGDQNAEHSAAVGQVSDRPVGLVVDANGEEPLEPRATLVEHAERGVLRARELTGGLKHTFQNDFEVEFRDEITSDVEQAS